MQQHIYYTKYALQFADMQIPELVTVFNHQVGNTGWSNMRAYHDQALIDEFKRRGIDVSAISLLSMMASPSASPILSDTILPTIDLSSVTNNLYLSILLPCRLLLARGEHVIPYNLK